MLFIAMFNYTSENRPPQVPPTIDFQGGACVKKHIELCLSRWSIEMRMQYSRRVVVSLALCCC